METDTQPNSIARRVLESWLVELSGEELKVALYLALNNNSASGEPMEKFRPGRIANATRLSKKQVRDALRLLNVSATFSDRFTMPLVGSSRDSGKPGRKKSPYVIFTNS